MNARLCRTLCTSRHSNCPVSLCRDWEMKLDMMTTLSKIWLCFQQAECGSHPLWRTCRASSQHLPRWECLSSLFGGFTDTMPRALVWLSSQLSSAWLQVVDLAFLQVKFQTLCSSTFLYPSQSLQTFHPDLLELSCFSSWEICRCVSDFPAFSSGFALPLLLSPQSTLVAVFPHHLTSISLSWEEPHLHLS